MSTKTPKQISNTMKKVKNKDTNIEKILRKELWKRGLRYRKNYRKVLGAPDIVFVKKKVAIFCDSEFWHGFNWIIQKQDFKSNQDYWIPKIERNIERDKIVTKALEDEGWIVMRFWGEQIVRNVALCAEQVELALRNRIENM